MKISTCAHGAFPDLKSLAHSGPRIAFVNGDSRPFAARGTHEVGNLLIVVADDLSRDQIHPASRIMLQAFGFVASVYKRLYLRHSAASGSPHVPMAVSDAHAILAFVERVLAGGAKELLVSCEYGKSRSVSLAGFLDQHFFMHSAIGKVPNPWVYGLLERASKGRRAPQSSR